jgi:hypothetical protein
VVGSVLTNGGGGGGDQDRQSRRRNPQATPQTESSDLDLRRRGGATFMVKMSPSSTAVAAVLRVLLQPTSCSLHRGREEAVAASMAGAAEVAAVAITMWGGAVRRLWVVLLHRVWLGSPRPDPQREDGRHRREGGREGGRACPCACTRAGRGGRRRGHRWPALSSRGVREG